MRLDQPVMQGLESMAPHPVERLICLAACRTQKFRRQPVSECAYKSGNLELIFWILDVLQGMASPYPTFARSIAMRLTFQARQTRFHSPVTLPKPRKENCLKPITDLMMPNTGSTVCLRSA